MDFLIVGISHKTAPLSAREAVVLDPEKTFLTLEQIKRDAVLREAMIVSTCNRTEVCAVRNAAGATAYIGDLIEKQTGSGAVKDAALRYVIRDRQAVRHLFMVGSGLDSMMVGEAQITGQIKEAYSTACRAKTTGAFLNKLAHMTFRIAKKVRTSTAVGEGSVSVVSASVQQLAEDLDGLDGRAVLLIGAGRNGELAAKHLEAQKVSALCIASRSYDKALRLAQLTDAEPFGLDAIPELLARVDAVLSTTASPGFLVTPAMAAEAMARRARRPLVIADLAAPRDVDPAVAAIDGVRLHDLDGFKTQVDRNLERRRAEAEKAEALVDHQVSSFLAWYRSLMAQPITLKIEERIERMRREELDKLANKLDPEQFKKVDHFSRILLRRFLQEPLSRIKLCDRSSHAGMLRLDTIRDLFGLSDDEAS